MATRAAQPSVLTAAVKLEGAGVSGPFELLPTDCGTNVQGSHISIDSTPVGRTEGVLDPMQASPSYAGLEDH